MGARYGIATWAAGAAALSEIQDDREFLSELSVFAYGKGGHG
jgi:hypothetical protein